MSNNLRLQQPDLTKGQWREIAQKQGVGLAYLNTVIAILVERLGGSVEIAGQDFTIPRELGFKTLGEVTPTILDAQGQAVQSQNQGISIISKRVQQEAPTEEQGDGGDHV